MDMFITNREGRGIFFKELGKLFSLMNQTADIAKMRSGVKNLELTLAEKIEAREVEEGYAPVEYLAQLDAEIEQISADLFDIRDNLTKILEG